MNYGSVDENRQVGVPTVLANIASMLAHDQGHINNLDTGPGGGTHGQRMADAFQVAAQAAQQSGSNDAGDQLAAAAQAMRQQGQGKAAAYYADGLEQAASAMQGRQGISLSDLTPFLQSFLGGVQRNNPAQPGQGTMIDAIGPAVGALMNSRGQGGGIGSAVISALGAAVSGARGTAQAPGSGGVVDPGAASATGVIGGIVSSMLPGLLSGAMSAMTSGGGGGGYGQPSMGGQGGLGGLLGALGGMMGGGQAGGSAQQNFPGPSTLPGQGWPYGSSGITQS